MLAHPKKQHRWQAWLQDGVEPLISYLLMLHWFGLPPLLTWPTCEQHLPLQCSRQQWQCESCPVASWAAEQRPHPDCQNGHELQVLLLLAVQPDCCPGWNVGKHETQRRLVVRMLLRMAKAGWQLWREVL